MKKLLALLFLSPLSFADVLYFDCKLRDGTRSEVIKIDRNQKKFIFQNKYLSNFRETETLITAENETRKFEFNKLDGTLKNDPKIIRLNGNRYEYYQCFKTIPFIQ